ncbi:T9SS type B sorting domain-containing protein [Myroides marinus]|nr:T9SS type B sorting domain-containing protein [Myroides marinus]MDM1371235.1 T9SS type B sorting domain-containing protein [Myroides marinus]
MWLSLFVLSGALSVGAVVGGINPYDYIGNKAIAEVASEQEEPKPEVKVGKPHDLIKCAPPATITTTMQVLLREALDGKDAEGNERLPKGYKYAFYATEDNAKKNIAPITNEYVDIAGEPKVYWVRVYSVLDVSSGVPMPVTISKSTSEDCSFNDQLVSLSDMYQSGKADGTMKFDIATRFNTVYYGQNTKYIVRTKGIDGKGPINIIDQPAQPLDPNTKFEYNGSNNEVIEIEVTSKDGQSIGTREFSLHIEEVLLDQYTAKVEGLIDSTDENGKNKGTFDLSVVKKQLRANQDSIYLDLKFFERVRNEKNILIDTPIVDVTKYVYDEAKVSCKECMVLVKVNDKKLMTDPKGEKDVTINMIFTSRPPIKQPLTNLTRCGVAGEPQNFDLTIRDDEAYELIEKEGKKKEDYVVTYHISKTDAEKGVNLLKENFVSQTSKADKIWVRLSTKDGKNFNVSSFYVSVGYNNIRTNSIGNQLVCSTTDNVNLSGYDGILKGQQIIENNPDYPVNPLDADLIVKYYTKVDEKNKGKNIPIEQDSDFKEIIDDVYKIKLGEISEDIYAKVFQDPSKFDCPTDDFDKEGNVIYRKFNITLNYKITAKYLPEETSLQFCENISTGKQDSKRLEVIVPDLYNTGKSNAELAQDFNFKWTRWFKKDGKDASETVGSGEGKYFIDATEIGEYYVTFNTINGYNGIPTCGLTSPTWKIVGPPKAVVEGADETGMINSMEVDEKGETMVRLGVLDGGTSTVTDGYEFAIDNSAFQPSSQFYNVPIGEHVAYARNIKTGCSASIKFSVFGYPKYFTPNGDGYNDTWNIPGLKGHNEARIYIYDKSGRLLKQLSPHTEGWDGTWNGKQMPSTDYWFTVEFVNDYKTPDERNGRKVSYKGHFSLKR